MIQRKGGINLHRSMGPGRDQTCDPWICSQTRICYQTRYRDPIYVEVDMEWFWIENTIQLLTIETLDMMWCRSESTNIDRGQLRHIILAYLFYHIWAWWLFWWSDLNIFIYMISAQTVIEKWTFQDFSNIHALGIKFDLSVNHTFAQTTIWTITFIYGSNLDIFIKFS